MKYTIFDIEANGLLDTITKIHCISYKIFDGKELVSQGTITDYNTMVNFLVSQEILIGHSIVTYDIPAIERILGVQITNKLIDTLGISYYLFPMGSKYKHGLEYWGERFGIEKPKIADVEWLGPLEGETQEKFIAKMIHRCQEDVEINSTLFQYQMDYLMNIYSSFNKVMRLIGYLTYKMDCLREQQECGLKLDVRLAEESKHNLEFELQDKIESLSKNMPPEIGKLDKSKPKIPIKKDGTLSVHGEAWYKMLKDKGLPEDTLEIRDKPNPGSDKQLKGWLFDLGWKPETFKPSKSTGAMLPQVSLPFGAGLCPSIYKLIDIHPFLIDLDGLFKAKHRFGVFKSLLEAKDENDMVYARAHGFTNTLRLTHSKPIVNLPKVGTYFGEEIRGSLTVPDDRYILCGSDISGLEDNTKQHYIYFFDPQYVIDMRVPGFDAHIDIAVLAGLLTEDDEVYFKWYNTQGDTFIFSSDETDRMKVIKVVRSKAKTVNFSATYGAGPSKIAETLGCTLEFAQKLHSTYWERNKAVKQTANSCVIRKVSYTFMDFIKEKYEEIKVTKTDEGPIEEVIEKTKKVMRARKKLQKWLYNPVSGFWMFLKADKDKFSTLNQSTGVYVFDSWVRRTRQKFGPLAVKIALQYHDEVLFWCLKELKNPVEIALKTAMVETNEDIKLNVNIEISIDWGLRYSDCH